MKSKYHSMTKHIPGLDDHGRLFMYYGVPVSDEYYIYGDEEDDDNLVVSYECDELCRAIAKSFEHKYKWLDILEEHHIRLEDIFDVDVETQELSIIASLLLYLDESLILVDKFIDALNNGYLSRLLKRLAILDEGTR